MLKSLKFLWIGLLCLITAGVTYVPEPLLPNTTYEHLQVCSEAFEVDKEFQEILTCANEKVFSKIGVKINPPKPLCYVVTDKSPDLSKSKEFNYVRIYMSKNSKVLGFFMENPMVMYIAETYDIKFIYQHEMLHYFLKLVENSGDPNHESELWTVCSTARYSPSEKSIESHSN